LSIKKNAGRCAGCPQHECSPLFNRVELCHGDGGRHQLEDIFYKFNHRLAHTPEKEEESDQQKNIRPDPLQHAGRIFDNKVGIYHQGEPDRQENYNQVFGHRSSPAGR
jgi:hypothetical protein